MPSLSTLQRLCVSAYSAQSMSFVHKQHATFSLVDCLSHSGVVVVKVCEVMRMVCEGVWTD